MKTHKFTVKELGTYDSLEDATVAIATVEPHPAGPDEVKDVGAGVWEYRGRTIKEVEVEVNG